MTEITEKTSSGPGGNSATLRQRPNPELTIFEGTPTLPSTADMTIPETSMRSLPIGEKIGVMQALRGWEVVNPFPARGSEADIFLIKKDAEQRILKLYRLGIQPKEEILEKLLVLSNSKPQYFAKIFETGYDAQTGRFFEMQEYFPAGTLFDALKIGRLTETQILSLLQKIFNILEVLHDGGILHLDLKPGNILLRSTDPSDVVITDFGIASLLGEEFSKKMTEVKGTTMYQSPESLSGVVGPKSDWWSIGMILLETLIGEHPFKNLPPQAVLFNLTTSDIAVPKTLSTHWQNILQGILRRNVDVRWGREEVSKWLQTRAKSSASLSEAGVRKTSSAGSEIQNRLILKVPYEFRSVAYKTLEELLQEFSSSPQSWNDGMADFIKRRLIHWLEENHDLERSEQISRILAQVSNADLGLFQIISIFRPDLPLNWHGRSIDRVYLEEILNKVAAASETEAERVFMENFTGGRIQEIAKYCGVHFDDDIARYFALAQSLRNTPLAELPLAKRAMILLATVNEIFQRFNPTKPGKAAQGKNPEIDLLFRIAGSNGFIPWAIKEGILDGPSAVLWRFLLECHKNGLSGAAAKVLESISGREEKLIVALTTKDKFQEDLIQFLREGDLTENIFIFFTQNRKIFPWWEDLLMIQFRLKTKEDIELFIQRYSLFLKIKTNCDLFREYILPPCLGAVIDQGQRFPGKPHLLRNFLVDNRLELFHDTISNPATLIRRGNYGIADWPTFRGFLEEHGIKKVDPHDSASLKGMCTIASRFALLDGLKKNSSETQTFDWRVTKAGFWFALFLIPTGLGVLPGLLFFIIGILLHEVERHRKIDVIGNEIRTLIQALEKNP